MSFGSAHTKDTIVNELRKLYRERIDKLTAEQNKKTASRKNLFDLCWEHQDMGKNQRFTRSIWRRPECYWTVTNVQLTLKDKKKRGRAWGLLTWRGLQEGEEREITSTLKKEWHIYDPKFYEKFLDPKKYVQNQHLSGGIRPKDEIIRDVFSKWKKPINAL